MKSAYSKCVVSENRHHYYLVHHNCPVVSDVHGTLASFFCVS